MTVVRESPGDKFEVVENAQTEPGARTMALDTKTHRVYLVTAKFGPPPAGQTGGRFRRSVEPGSFVVLVVGR